MSKRNPIIAILGRANVGKSSLLNRLSGRRDSIVHNQAGTTRDNLYVKARLDDQYVWLVDTAGLKKPSGELELNIQEQIKQATAAADLILVVVEAPIGITEEDRRVAKQVLKSTKPVILVVNKLDKAKRQDLSEFHKLGIQEMVYTSVTQGKGIEGLTNMLSAFAAGFDTAPPTEELRIALVGRPNVGKSMVFNQLAETHKAVVSEQPGTTRDVNRLYLNQSDGEVLIMDTAGVRRSSQSARGVEYYSALRTLAAIEEADVCVLVVDALEAGTKLDQKIAGMVKDAGRGLIIALNKWDLVDQAETSFDDFAARIGYEFQFVYWASLMPVSGLSGKNVANIVEAATDIQRERRREIKTRQLNRWLSTVIGHHPPAGLKNKHPKLRYVTQVGSEPPMFKFFGSDTKFLHWSYKRYMEKELRREFGFEGTTIKFAFSDSKD